MNYKKKLVHYLHFSIDDVNNIFEDLHLNEANYKSIFENKILKQLNKLHLKYNFKVTLYVFFENMNSSYNLAMNSSKYMKEFKKNANWLKFGWHGINGKIKLKELSDSEYKLYFKKFNIALKKTTSKKSNKMIRLHDFIPTPSQESFLYNNKIRVLFYDKNYDKNNSKMKYLKTNIRLENCEDIEKILYLCKNERIVSIFTHEWCFWDDYDKISKKIEDLCSWASDNKYKYK